LKLVPETWRNPYSTSTSPEWETSVRPGSEIGQVNANGELGTSELEGRRKAKAVFVVLGVSAGHGQGEARVLADTAQHGTLICGLSWILCGKWRTASITGHNMIMSF
jgi:hypothetical protein